MKIRNFLIAVAFQIFNDLFLIQAANVRQERSFFLKCEGEMTSVCLHNRYYRCFACSGLHSVQYIRFKIASLPVLEVVIALIEIREHTLRYTCCPYSLVHWCLVYLASSLSGQLVIWGQILFLQFICLLVQMGQFIIYASSSVLEQSSVRPINLSLYFFRFKCCVSQLSVDKFGKIFGGLMTLGQFKSVPNFFSFGSQRAEKHNI